MGKTGRYAARAVVAMISVLGPALTGSAALAGQAGPAGQPGLAGQAAGAIGWQPLTLANGWQPVAGAGVPSWAVRDGIAYLSGELYQPAPAAGDFAVLPAAARPARELYIAVSTSGGTHGYLTVGPAGDLHAASSPAGDAVGLTSLAGVSFPVAATPRHRLTLLYSWQSSQHARGTGDPSYTVSGGVVCLSGSLHRTSGFWPQFAVLPASARPASKMFVSVYADGGADGALLIYPDGKILAFLGGTARFTSLAGVSFPAVIPARHGLTLLNGWESAHSAYGTANPGYRVIHGVVYLSGGLRQPHGSDGQFAVLPAGARPASALAFPVYSAGFVGTLEIQPDGTMTASSSPLQNARTFTSLAGISYPLGT